MEQKLYFDTSWKKIGISLSGGADSALLAYLLIKETDADVYFTTQIRMWKTRPWQEFVAKQVVDWFKNKFSNNIHHIYGFIPPELEEPASPLITDEYGNPKSGNRLILRSHNEYIAYKYNLDAWFCAVNKNPDVDFPGSLEERNTGVLPLHVKHMNVDVFHPFVNTTKDWIIQQYYNNNILDLFDITRSCEGDKINYPEVFGDLDYTNYKPGQYVPKCEQCFWCREREWALNNVKA